MSADREKTKLALYRKYRPTKLANVIGQPQVTDILSAMAERHDFAQAYLFTGQRGTGKTTVARILAHLINETPYDDAVDSSDIDIIEIDAASNNSVDDVREIRDGVQLAPMKSSHKVYIIDEFHMLSKAAFNALLKTIEEPPEYVVFILATTELQKVPATILSRVQRFHFKPVAEPVLAEHLHYIAESEKIDVDDAALRLIARSGGGSVRDSISLLDQLSSGGKITGERVINTLGLVPDETLDGIISSVKTGDATRIIAAVQGVLDGGTSPDALATDLINRLSGTALESPTNYTLIDKLLEVRGSAIPSAKLLAVLVTMALSNVPIAEAIPKLAKKQAITAPTLQSHATAPAKVATAQAVDQSPKKLTTASTKTIRTVKPPKSAASKIPSVGKTDAIKEGAPSIDLVWDDLVGQVKADDQPSIVSILEQCDYRYNKGSGELTLYFGNKFFRDQAKGAIFGNVLKAAATKLYGTAPSIIVSDSAAPTNSGVAAVLNAIGGELTKVDDGTK